MNARRALMAAVCSLTSSWMVPIFASTAHAEQYSTPAEARAVLERAVAAVKKDKSDALSMFTKGESGFRNNDLSVYCGGPDGNFTAHQTLVGKSLRHFRDKAGRAVGEDIYAAAKEGEISAVHYMWPLPGETEPVEKIAYVTKIRDQICAVSYYGGRSADHDKAAMESHAPKFPGLPIRTTRVFSGPEQYPPCDFAAYGIVAFKSGATSETRARHMMLCEAYVATFPHASQITAPPEMQMVTAWPVVEDKIAEDLNKSVKIGAPLSEGCSRAVDSYGLVLAMRAMQDAQITDKKFDGRGPYLLPWPPGDKKGQADALILVYDLSHIQSHETAMLRFQQWRDDIEENPEL